MYSPEKNAMIAAIMEYWVTASGEPELSDFADYMLNIVDTAKISELHGVMGQYSPTITDETRHLTGKRYADMYRYCYQRANELQRKQSS